MGAFCSKLTNRASMAIDNGHDAGQHILHKSIIQHGSSTYCDSNESAGHWIYVKSQDKRTKKVPKKNRNKGETLFSAKANSKHYPPKSTTPHPGLYFTSIKNKHSIQRIRNKNKNDKKNNKKYYYNYKNK